ncbi:hypothetical protein Nhal_3919 [Nitrosococcus halophilus Nc 4]|uniref:Uncharacterized protein n=1 Tax=Nitrosococcus halophilus (strain Nc4) TaxID=472759 RepID=D5C3Z2_NITHN|nr:hypothetical protein Nhal_3919 [Nitrosococcus halophilus Nc 4]
MREKKKAVEALRRDGHIPPENAGSKKPGQLSIADYLKQRVMGPRFLYPLRGHSQGF